MRIVQFLPTIAFGDAVSNDAIALGKAMNELGYETDIFAENIDRRLPKGTAKGIGDKMPETGSGDIIIYHLSTGTRLNYAIEKYDCRKIMIYHNITPPHFFAPYNPAAAALTQEGIEGMKHLADKFDFCLADSDFNRDELIGAGYKCPIEVRPILIPFEDYEKKPDGAIIRKYGGDDWVNILFVGRIAPNKKHQDIISAFCWYKKNINPKSRLIFVGSYGGMENYYNRLQKYVRALELDDVIFTGHIKFPEILAYYHVADVFLCMSEHEGFCVPLTEAMYFDVPIIAYNSCAIPSTLGGSGLLTDSKDPAETALLIDRLMKDEALKNAVIAGQRRRLADFSYEKIKELFAKQLQDFISGEASR